MLHGLLLQFPLPSQVPAPRRIDPQTEPAALLANMHRFSASLQVLEVQSLASSQSRARLTQTPATHRSTVQNWPSSQSAADLQNCAATSVGSPRNRATHVATASHVIGTCPLRRRWADLCIVEARGSSDRDVGSCDRVLLSPNTRAERLEAQCAPAGRKWREKQGPDVGEPRLLLQRRRLGYVRGTCSARQNHGSAIIG
jgi:hypothetical protein